MKKTKKIDPYPELTKLGLKVHEEPIQHVKWTDVQFKLEELEKARPGTTARFKYLAMGATCIEQGAYPWDLEDYFANIFYGKSFVWD